MHNNLRKLTLAIAIAWPIVGIVSRAAAEAFARLDGSPVQTPGLLRSLLAWVAWSLLTPAVVATAVRLPIRRGSVLGGILLHALAGTSFVLLHLGLVLAMRNFDLSEPPLPLAATINSVLKYGFICYAVMVAAVLVLQRHRAAAMSRLLRHRLERQLAAARLQRTLAAVDLPALLEALDALREAIDRDPAAAEEALHELSDDMREKLRRSLQHGSAPPPRITVGDAGAPDPTALERIGSAVYPLYAIYATIVGAIAIAAAGALRWPIILQIFVGYAIAASLWPLVASVSRRLAGANAPWSRTMTTVGATCLAHALVAEAVIALLRPTGLVPPAGHAFGPVLLLSFTGASFLQSALHSERHVAERQRGADIARDVAESQLRALRTQLTPHFLFNVLNSVLCLLEVDPAGAKVMLARLRRLLELTGRDDSRETVPLRDDLELAASYLDIERTRFGEALVAHVEIDATLERCRVPAFFLQPLLENAVRHGSLGSRGRGTIRLRAERVHGSMEIRIDNQSDLLRTQTWKEGIGLSNLRERLTRLYGETYALSIVPLADGGFSVRIRLPLAWAEGAA